jgi:hypothetical protein
MTSAMAWLLSAHAIVAYAVTDGGLIYLEVCQACSCPRGDRLTFLVSNDDAAALLALELGFYL